MGIGNLLRSCIDMQFCGEEIIRTQIQIFNKNRNLYPSNNQHYALALTWLARMRCHGLDNNDPFVQKRAFIDTYLYACLPPPECARALGLYIIYKENKGIVEAYPKFQEEYARLMLPVYRAEEEGRLEQLYGEYNPEQEIDSES